MSIGASPIKMHSMPKHRRISYANEKINRTIGKMKETFASAIGVEVGEFPSQQEPDCASKEFEKKAIDLDKLTEATREKLPHSDYRHKVQLLTLTPESWSIKYASNYFQVSEYLIRRARELKRQQGINALPDQNTGKILPEDTLAHVRSFFEDDEYSRLLPGKKDVVSIGRNVHKQKRLLLCNLKELYASFKEKYPNARLGFSKFCSLRPKWCITAGASGVHSVCVCSIHKNAILLVDAANTGKTYKDMMEMIVCSRDNNHCMIHRCKDCPGTTPLHTLLEEALSHLEGHISFLQWQSTDRSELINQSLCSVEFIQNYKNMLNLCLHKADFGLPANWTFFATSHGKSACDGIGGTVKRLTARASLQRPYSEQILTVPAMLEFCQKNIEEIAFLYISKQRMVSVREELKDRFSRGRTIPGTRSFISFPHQVSMRYSIKERRKIKISKVAFP